MITKEKLTYKDFTDNLEQFIGSTQFYRVGITPIIATEGIKYFADTCECYWLLDLITINLFPIHRKLGCLFIDIEVNKRHTVCITVRQDSDMPIVFKKKQRDLCKIIPVGTYKFYLMNNTLLLPSEY